MIKPENTLYLNIKQEYFDQIMAGTKNQEFREVKPTTIKKLIQLDEEGMEEEDECGNALPIIYDAIHFRVGMNKVADEAIVEVVDTKTEIFVDENNQPIEYVTDEDGNILYTDGKKTFTDKEIKAMKFSSKAEADKFYKSIWMAEPERNENGDCVNGLIWVQEQVVFTLGKILEKNIVSK